LLGLELRLTHEGRDRGSLDNVFEAARVKDQDREGNRVDTDGRVVGTAINIDASLDLELVRADVSVLLRVSADGCWGIEEEGCWRCGCVLNENKRFVNGWARSNALGSPVVAREELLEERDLV